MKPAYLYIDSRINTPSNACGEYRIATETARRIKGIEKGIIENSRGCIHAASNGQGLVVQYLIFQNLQTAKDTFKGVINAEVISQGQTTGVYSGGHNRGNVVDVIAVGRWREVKFTTGEERYKRHVLNQGQEAFYREVSLNLRAREADLPVYVPRSVLSWRHFVELHARVFSCEKFYEKISAFLEVSPSTDLYWFLEVADTKTLSELGRMIAYTYVAVPKTAAFRSLSDLAAAIGEEAYELEEQQECYAVGDSSLVSFSRYDNVVIKALDEWVSSASISAAERAMLSATLYYLLVGSKPSFL